MTVDPYCPVGPKDAVTCFYCGNTLMDWMTAIASTNETIVQLEHARFFPCRFVTYTAGGKFVANAGYFHSISPQGRPRRRRSAAFVHSVPSRTSRSKSNEFHAADEFEGVR